MGMSNLTHLSLDFHISNKMMLAQRAILPSRALARALSTTATMKGEYPHFPRNMPTLRTNRYERLQKDEKDITWAEADKMRKGVQYYFNTYTLHGKVNFVYIFPTVVVSSIVYSKVKKLFKSNPPKEEEEVKKVEFDEDWYEDNKPKAVK